MHRWLPYTFLRVTFFLIVGISAAFALPFTISRGWQYGLVLICVALYIIIFLLNRFRRWDIINPGAIGLLGIMAIGYGSVGLRTEANNPDHISYRKDSIAYYKGTVIGEPESRAWGRRILVEVEAVRAGYGWHKATGKVMLRLPASGEQIRYGDVLVVRGQPQPIPGPANPGEFDYRQYLANHQVVRQQTVTGDDLRKTGYAPPSYIMNAALGVRRWAEGVIQKYVPRKQEQAIAIALVLGVTDGLNAELVQAYASTGTLHVLAVSGLHISILYLIVMMLLKPLRRLPPAYSRWVSVVLGVLILWGYAFVTGLSPSVLRAVFMFSLMAMARLRRQPAKIYNILGASAFLLLIYDPYNLVSVGFQLSYLAVLGIVGLHPGISSIIKPKYWITEKVWEMVSMSLAAQLATFSLSLLYFHQFPNYFLFANLVAIPVSFVILVAGLVLLAAAVIPVVASVVGTVLAWVIYGMNVVIGYFEKLPFSYTADVFITPAQCALLMCMIVAGAVWIYYKQLRYGILLVVMATGFSALQWQHYYAIANTRRLIVYNVPGQTAIDLVDRGVVYFTADSALDADPRRVAFHVTPNRIQLNATYVVKDIPFQCTFPGIRVTACTGLSVIQIHARNAALPARVKADVLILSHNAVYNLAEVLKHIDAATIVLDSSNSLRYTQYIMQLASKLHVQVHAVRIAGAFQYTYQ